MYVYLRLYEVAHNLNSAYCVWETPCTSPIIQGQRVMVKVIKWSTLMPSEYAWYNDCAHQIWTLYISKDTSKVKFWGQTDKLNTIWSYHVTQVNINIYHMLTHITSFNCTFLHLDSNQLPREQSVSLHQDSTALFRGCVSVCPSVCLYIYLSSCLSIILCVSHPGQGTQVFLGTLLLIKFISCFFFLLICHKSLITSIFILYFLHWSWAKTTNTWKKNYNWL